jgi:hypothetical protein
MGRVGIGEFFHRCASGAGELFRLRGSALQYLQRGNRDRWRRDEPSRAGAGAGTRGS